MITLTAEQAQQIEEALEDIVRVFKFETGTPVEALASFRAARAQGQAEQEPVAVVEITYGREPECYVTGNIDDFPEGVFKLYAAPVRTVDLTDDEIMKINVDTASIVPTCDRQFHFARAVIAADREKNK